MVLVIILRVCQHDVGLDIEPLVPLVVQCMFFKELRELLSFPIAHVRHMLVEELVLLREIEWVVRLTEARVVREACFKVCPRRHRVVNDVNKELLEVRCSWRSVDTSYHRTCARSPRQNAQ